MKKLVLFLVVPALAACSNLPMPDTSSVTNGVSNVANSLSNALDVTPYLDPYRIDVRQGNLVTQEMVAQLKPGQTRDQVRFILGTPLLSDIFHADRWDYVYRFKPGNGAVQQRKFVVFFKDGKLVRVDGDVVGENPLTTTVAAPARPATRMIEIKAPEGSTKPDAADTNPPAPAASSTQ